MNFNKNTALLFLFFSLTTQTFASDIRTGEKLHLSKSEQFENLYTIGQDVILDSPVKGDIVTAGNDITINGPATGSIMALGGNISITGTVGNSVRVMGGNISISGHIQHDIVVVGGTVTIEKTALIGGDVIFAGGTLIVNGPVRGRVLMRGGSITIASVIGGSVNGNAGTLFLNKGTEVMGDVSYTSSQRALINDGAIVRGQEVYHAAERKNNLASLLRGILYALVTDVLFALLLVTLIPNLISQVVKQVKNKPFKNGLVGLGFLILVPFIAILLLMIFWLGISVFLLYFLFLILALFLAKLILGYYALEWWNTRNKTLYKLDWKAAVVGPLLMAILLLIPVIGWILAVLIYLITLGSLVFTANHIRQIPATKG